LDEHAAQASASRTRRRPQALLQGDEAPDQSLTDDARQQGRPHRVPESEGCLQDQDTGEGRPEVIDEGERCGRQGLHETGGHEKSPRVDSVRRASRESHGDHNGECKAPQEPGHGIRTGAGGVDAQDERDHGHRVTGERQRAGDEQDACVPKGRDLAPFLKHSLHIM